MSPRGAVFSGRHYYGYTVVAACFFMQAVAVGALVTYGVFFKHLQAEFGWSRTFISGASSIVLVIMGVFGVLFGRLNDRLGPRRILLASGLCLTAGYLLMSLLDAGWQLYVFYGLLIGVGLSSHDVVTLSTVARWFRRRRGMMTGIVKAGTGTGQFLVPVVASALILAYGWRTAYVAIAVAIFVVYVLVSRLVKGSPTEIGLNPDGDTGENARPVDTSGLSFGQGVRSLRLWFCCLSYWCVIFCTMTILVHIVPHATDIGMAEPRAAALVSTIGAVSIVGRITMGTVSDRLGGRKAFLLSFAVLISALIWLQFSAVPWMLFTFVVVYGFAHGGFYTVLSPTVAELFGLRAHGAIFGTVYLWGTLGGAAGPVVAGRLFDMQHNYDTAFMLLLVLSLVALLLMLPVRPLATVAPGRPL